MANTRASLVPTAPENGSANLERRAAPVWIPQADG
jgi:hypothetical protein